MVNELVCWAAASQWRKNYQYDITPQSGFELSLSRGLFLYKGPFMWIDAQGWRGTAPEYRIHPKKSRYRHRCHRNREAHPMGGPLQFFRRRWNPLQIPPVYATYGVPGSQS